MGNAVYPVLPGLEWPVKRRARWQTSVDYSASGRRFATSHWTYPVYEYELGYEFLRRTPTDLELDSLWAFFQATGGRLDSFLFTDPDDSLCTAVQIGVGDGVNRDFRLQRAIGQSFEPVGAANGAITVTANGSPTTAYALIDFRTVRMNVAPAAGVVMRWTGAYFQRCAFLDDEMDFEKFMSQFWRARVRFETVKD